MFDPITTQLIRASPPLDGLDLESLPKQLTSAFADIVAARILLRSASSEPSPDLLAKLSDMRRLAAAHEAYVVLLPERTNRAAAAFVAASAHQACMLGRPDPTRRSGVNAASLTPDICATLLFLVAESNADAAEAAKRISPGSEGTNPIERALLNSIRNLAQGHLVPILRESVPDVAPIDTDVQDRALQALQQMLLKGVKSLAAQIRRRTDLAPHEGGIEPASNIFLQVKALCIEPIADVFGPSDRVYSLFPGPLHLANLLLAVERDLLGTALARVPTPGGLPETGWWQIIRRMARDRPYLWRNHREAIASGYLDQGVSSAISFPTGGGKSTLAELKIATALLRGEKVVFLAPTHSLVGQTARALKKTFQSYDIIGDIDEEVTFSDAVVLPEVTVTTPERCLMLMSIQPEAFAGLGLIVFDECHLLHPRDEDRSRRGLDAMLALLNLTSLAPAADLLLLSAMMKNTVEISGWIEWLTGRKCLTLDLAWKPTRQVRGCVVYPAEQISNLNKKIRETRRAKPELKGAPATLKRELFASPFGLFSLLQTWSTMDRQDYALLPLLEAPLLLATGVRKRGGWYLTPNGNEISGAIAAASVSAGMKTLVFVQTTVFCEKCIKDFRGRLAARPVSLSVDERAWYEYVVEELGGAEHCYLQLDPDGLLRAGAASHHALLLREERELHEALFKRRDGIDALFATSTLAQGMNLPSEVVVISGDSRFDPGADKMKKLEAHELLNAAGRAGRAGDGAQGFVLLVPSKVIEFDDKKNEINDHWLELQSIFEQSDQCLIIEDPMENLLDQIHDGIVKTGTSAYLLSKLPLRVDSESIDPAESLLKRSLAVYRAKKASNENWITTRVSSALAARSSVHVDEKSKWIEHVAGSTGLSVQVLQQLIQSVDSGMFEGNTVAAIKNLLDWIAKSPAILMDLVRPENLEGLFGGKYKKLHNDAERAKMALASISKLLPLWMGGLPLNRIEADFLERSDDLGQCEYARHFVSRVVPDLAFVAGLPARLLAARAKSGGKEPQLPIVIATLGSAVREGCDSPEALATRINCGRSVSRVGARKAFEGIRKFASVGNPTESFEMTRDRMRSAQMAAAFAAL